MNNLGDNNNFFKNPIGVIGFFLVLTEAIASLVIANTSLNDMQNTILVLFIVFFPCLVLFVFYLLVTRHHEKLYSPSDYKDEQNFVNTYNRVTQEEEMLRVDSINGEIDETSLMSEKSLESIRDALVDLMELQKKIVPNIESSTLTEDEKSGFVTNIEDHLLEIGVNDKRFKVEICHMRRSSILAEKLLERGYDTMIYRSFRERKEVLANEQHEAIWLGSEVPVNMTTDVVRLAKDFYPHLKYIHLSDAKDGAPDFVKYRIFIGGATSTAKMRRLKALQPSDFNDLCAIKDKQELHDFINSFKP